MEPWAWWLVAAGVLLVGELLTTTLVLGMVAAGAAAGALAAAVGAPAGLQVVAAAVVSLLLLLVVRPVAERHRRQPVETRTGVDALPGAEAVVLARVDGQDGRIKLGGEVWSARAYDPGASFEVGQHVQVMEISGATALVG
jgi:membrane protein implicated in regulation of membrane protease activity